ncbi:kelch domain-containing protein 10 [Copidosoma floridanum]|uniref:kelch domain-containing protein 10 n=1 Tax=Copidosoma floridanum TaxID=29053 RepID=UPI0006C9B277|nr:kelch domain-containing protein 10 [Copidosoma floridanum]
MMYALKPFTFVQHEVKSAEKPKARSGHRVVCDERNLYSYGGFNPSITANDPDMQNDQSWTISRPLFKELWKYNFATKRWKRLPCQKTMPNELASNAVILRGVTLLVHGGTGVPFGDNCNNNVYVCNVNDGQMQVVPATGELPDPQYGQAVICHGPYLYTVGGTTGLEYTCDIHRFDMRTQIWESVYICAGRDQCEPKGRYRHELAFDGRIIYVLGGGTASEAFGFAELPAFDTLTRRWMTLCTRGDIEKTYPAPRRCHGLVQFKDEKTDSTLAVISGGYNGTHVFSDIWRLDLELLQWTCLKTCVLPQPTYFHSTALTPAGQMFTFGGIVKQDNEVARTDEIHSVWLTVPKLSEICWEALDFYFPKLKEKAQSDLLRIGVPFKFLHRL